MNSRSAMRERLEQKDQYDLIIIGGGITGCGVAYAAASRGLRVLVLEQGDFAIGTSSRSTKLIHGGIRYLKQMNFRLVREGVRERQYLIDAAPHLVHPVQFVYPVHAGDPDPLWTLRIGMILYDWYAGRRNLLKHQVFSGRSILQAEPLLRQEGVKGGALYADCLTDDARLTVEMAKAAADRGALLVNYVRVERFLYDDTGRMCGLEATDRMAPAKKVTVHAQAILNATGPWVDFVRRIDDPTCRPVMRPTKGVHIAVDHAQLPISRPVVMHAEDKRLMFAVPRDGFTYLGTTDTDYQGDPGAVTVDQSDVAYILNATSRMFPRVHLTDADVISAWAGLRPLAAASETAGPSQVSRDYKLHSSTSGLVSVAGGKLTAFHAMAQAIVRHLFPQLPHQEVPLELPGAQPRPSVEEAATLGQPFGLSAADIQEVWSRHGGQTPQVLAHLNANVPAGRERLLAAEAVYAVANEFAVTLSDVLNRRTSQLLFSRDNGTQIIGAVAAAMGEALGWAASQLDEQIASYTQEVSAMMAWRNGG